MVQTSTTSSYTPDLNPLISCTGFANTGPDRVFSVSVPAGQRLTSAVTSTTTGFDPSIYLLAGPDALTCAAQTCLDGDDTGAATATNTVSWDNLGNIETTVYIVVDSVAANGGDFTLASTLAPIPAGTRGGDQCSSTNAITTDTTLTAEDLATATNDYEWNAAPGCVTSGYLGKDRGYAVVVGAGMQLTVDVVRTAGTWTPSIQIVESCDLLPAVGSACLASSPARTPNTVTYRNRTGLTQSLFVLIDTASSPAAPATYDLTFTFATAPPIPAGDVCQLAVPAGASVTGTTVDFENNYSSGTGCALGVGRDTAFTITVPPGQRLVSSVTSTLPDGGTGINPALSLYAGTDAGVCGTTSCAASSNVVSTNTETLAWFNATDAGAAFFLVLDTTLSTDPGQLYTLTNTISAVPLGDRCEAPITLTPATARTGESLITAVNDYTGSGTSCSSVSTQGELVYQVSVPALSVLTVTVTPDATLNTSISLARTAADCAARVCVSNANTSTALGGVDTLTFSNRTMTPETLLVLVDSSTAGGGLFDIVATVTGIPPGDTCGSATFFDGGVLEREATSGFTNDYTSTGSVGCAFLSGNDRAYAVTIPPGQRGVFRGSPDGGADVSLNLIEAPASNCDGTTRSCVRSVNGFTSTATGDRTEVLTRYNATGVPEDLFLIVDSQTAGGLYDLTVSYDSPPAGDRCENPITLTSAVAQAGDFASLVNDYFGTGTGCTSVSTRADGVYAITAPRDSSIDVTVTPSAGLDTTISVATSVAACESRVCVANTNNGTSGNPDTLRVTNRTPNPQTYFFIVDHTTIGASSTFSITATVAAAQPGEFCGLATTTPALPVDGETLGGFANDYSANTGNCGSSSTTNGADRVYRVSMAPGRNVITLTPDSGMSIAGSIVEPPALNCEATPRVCVAGADLTTTTGPAGAERVAYSNPTATPQEVLLIVDTPSTNAGFFSMAQTVGPLVAGEDCATADPLTPDAGVLVGQTTGGFDSDYSSASSNGCAGSLGRDHVYSVVVPPGLRLNAFVQPDAGYNPAIDVMVGPQACARRECAATTNLSTSTGAAEFVGWTNGSAAPVQAFISVDGTTTATSGAGNFNLETWFSAPAPGETCGNALPVANGTVVTATTAGFSREVAIPVDANGCVTSAGRDIVYVVTVPRNQTLTVELTGVQADVALNLVGGTPASCTFAPSCLASSDVGGSGGDETATFVNPSSSALQVFIIIANFSATSTVEAGFTMAVTIN